MSLEANGVHLERGYAFSLKAPDFKLECGQIMRLKGPNGSGKSTETSNETSSSNSSAGARMLRSQSRALLSAVQPRNPTRHRENFAAKMCLCSEHHLNGSMFRNSL